MIEARSARDELMPQRAQLVALVLVALVLVDREAGVERDHPCATRRCSRTQIGHSQRES
jgi:hypothetical protein